MKTLQYFSDEYLAQCREMSSEQIARYLENFRIMMMGTQQKGKAAKQKAISIKMPEDLLERLKFESKKLNIPYQSLIKDLLYKSLG